MELTAQMAALEEEIKVLKGEIKLILTEIRTAVLNQDNPFVPGTGVPVFRPVERPAAASNTLAEGEPEVEDGSSASALQQAAASEPTDPAPRVVQIEPGADHPTSDRAPAPTPEPRVTPAEPVRSQPSTFGRPEAASMSEAEQDAAPTVWSASTIAALVAWADETASRVGPTHLQMILELARFAGLVYSEAEEPLLKVIKLASSCEDGAAASVNDCLVALRQLEAILRGELSEELALPRRRRGA
jgi:hypothetical protein